MGRLQLAIPSQQRPADHALTLAEASGAGHMRARGAGDGCWSLSPLLMSALRPATDLLVAPVRPQVCKNKLGSHKRAKSKREDMAEAMRQARMKA